MSSEQQNEQLVQEIVGQVLTASIQDHNKENGYQVPEPGSMPMEHAKEDEKALMQGKDVDAMAEKSAKENERVDNEEESNDGNLSSIQSPEKLDTLLDLSTSVNSHSATTDQDHSVVSINITNDEVISPNNLETKLMSDEEDNKENTEKINTEQFMEGVDSDKGFGPITPPVLGTAAAQEDHQLEQHEQQQQLFNLPSAAEKEMYPDASSPPKATIPPVESGEESEEPVNGLKANGKECAEEKAADTSTGQQHGGKAEGKPKTKMCTIL